MVSLDIACDREHGSRRVFAIAKAERRDLLREQALASFSPTGSPKLMSGGG